MKWLKKLFSMFRRKKEVREETPPFVPTTTPVFVPTPVTVPSPVAPVVAPIRSKFEGWPPGTYEFKPGVMYVPYDGSNGGPFTKPEEAWDWMKAVDQHNANSKANDEATAAQVFTGLFPAMNFVLGPREGAEAAFLYAASRLYGSSAFWWERGLFSGRTVDINGLINYGEQEQIFEQKSYEQTVADFPDTPVKKAVLKVIGRA